MSNEQVVSEVMHRIRQFYANKQFSAFIVEYGPDYADQMKSFYYKHSDKTLKDRLKEIEGVLAVKLSTEPGLNVRLPRLKLVHPCA